MTRNTTLTTSVPMSYPMIPRLTSASAGQSAGISLTAREVLGIVRRRLWWVGGITLFTTLVFVGLWYVFLRYYPRYTSIGLIQCKMPVQPDLLAGNNLVPVDAIIQLETKTKSAMMRNEAFLLDVLGRTNVKATTWYQSFQGITEAMKEFKNRFNAYPQRDTDLLLVSMTTSDPKEAQTIVNEAMNLFMINMGEQARKVMRDNLAALNEQRNQLERTINQKRQAMAQLSSKANAPGWQQGQTEAMQQMRTMLIEKLTLEAQLQQALVQKEQLQIDQQQMGVSNRVLFAVQQDPMVMGLRNRILGLVEERDQLLEKFGSDHLQVKSVEARIASAQQSIEERSQQLQNLYAGSETLSADREIESLQKDLQSVNGLLEESKLRQSEVEQIMAEYIIAKDELEYMNRSLEKFEDRIYSARVALQNPDLVSVKIYSAGHEPKEKSFPRLSVFLPAGIVLGLLLSAGLIFLLEFADDSVKTPSDVRRHLNIPLLGMVPQYQEKDIRQIEVAKIMMVRPHAMISDMFRKVRTNLFFSAPAEELKSIVVSGCTAECGTTTTAVNLAITLAGEGRRVLLIDGNFRRAALGKLFPSEGSPRGLSNVLVGQATAADVIRASGWEGLDLVDSGPLPPNPADLLNNSRMKDFLQRQKEFYDHIIIDGPPALLVSDARILAGLADGTILVVHAHDTSRGMAQRLVRELHSPRIRVLGLILNGVKPRKGGYFQAEIESYNEYVDLSHAQAAALSGGSKPSGS